MYAVFELLKRYPLAVGCFLLALLSVGTFVFRGGLLEAQTNEEQQLEARLRVIRANQKNAIGLEEDVTAIEGLQASLEERLFLRGKRAINIDYFYSLGDDLGVRVNSVNQGGEVPMLSKDGAHQLKLYSSINFTLNVEGSFQQLMEFVFKLHAIDAIARGSNFSLNRTRDGGLLGMQLQISVLAKK